MGWADDIRSVIKTMIIEEKDTLVEGTVASLNPLSVAPDGASSPLKGIYWNADLVEAVTEGDRVLMYFNKSRKRYYALVKLA